MVIHLIKACKKLRSVTYGQYVPRVLGKLQFELACCSVALGLELDDFQGLFWPKLFCDSVEEHLQGTRKWEALGRLFPSLPFL